MKSDTILSPQQFAIIEPDPVICMDLVGAVKAAFPQSTVDVSQFVTDALATIKSSDPALASIMLNGRLLTDSVLASLRELVAMGAKVVVIGTSERDDVPASFLDFPFTTEMVVNSIEAAVTGST